MRITLFDGLLETHVADSLERALCLRGHAVFNTGKFGHGFNFETRSTHLAGIDAVIDRVLEFRPDFILVFRPATLPPVQLSRLKATGAQMAVWLSDDPVLWDLSYRPVIDSYDIVLNCGTERVLSFYDANFGRPVGVNFPFWTDTRAFPYVYGRHQPESTAMFLGNVQDRVRRRRYFALSDLNVDVRIHGNTGLDFNHVGGGYLESDAEVVDAASRSMLAINIPQYFKDHLGLDTWFHGLDELGTFQYPSRVIQYAAMGLPIVSVTPQPEDYATFPELRLVNEVRDVDREVHELTREEGLLEELSVATHARFLSNYSAASRALALESLSADDSWRSLSSAERTEWFSQFDGSYGDSMDQTPNRDATCDSSNESIIIESSVASSREPDNEPMSSIKGKHSNIGLGRRVAIIGEGWTGAGSAASTICRALHRCGFIPERINSVDYPSVFLEDKSKEFRAFINVQELVNKVNPDVLILVGSYHNVSVSGRSQLDDNQIPLIVHGITNRTRNIINTKLAERADVITVNHPDLFRTLRAAGFRNAIRATPLVDQRFMERINEREIRSSEIRVIGGKRSDLSPHKELIQDLLDLGAKFDFIDERSEEPADLDALLDYVSAPVTVVAPNAELPGTQFSDYMGFALAVGSIVVTPRAPGLDIGGEPGVTHITARDRYELIRKLNRIGDDRQEFDRYSNGARDFAGRVYDAETIIADLVARASKVLSSRYVNKEHSLTVGPTTPKAGTLSSTAWSPNRISAPSRIAISIRFFPPLVNDLLDQISLVIKFGVDGETEARLVDLVGESKVWYTVPRGYSLPSVKVELRASSELPFYNWRDLINVGIEFDQTPHSDGDPSRGMTASNGYFQRLSL